MNGQLNNDPFEGKAARGDVFSGILGALVSAFLGAILFFWVYQLRLTAEICALVIFLAAYFGYTGFSGVRPGKKLWFLIVLSMVMIALAEFCSVVYYVYADYNAFYVSRDFFGGITVGEAASYAKALFIEDRAFRSTVIKEIIVSNAFLGFGIATAIFFEKNKITGN